MYHCTHCTVQWIDSGLLHKNKLWQGTMQIWKGDTKMRKGGVTHVHVHCTCNVINKINFKKSFLSYKCGLCEAHVLLHKCSKIYKLDFGYMYTVYVGTCTKKGGGGIMAFA